MLSDALFSVNKRAKNWRDKIREIRHYRYWNSKFDPIESAEKMMNGYYDAKWKLLQVIKPMCIHHEIHDKYFWLREDNTPWENTAKKTGRTGWNDWGNEVVEWHSVTHSYYLYYKCGNHTFHHPIDNPTDFPDLTVENLDDEIITFGEDIGTLVSTQFCKKLLELVKSGNYEFKPCKQMPHGVEQNE